MGSFRSSQVAGIGLSQSDPRRKKEILKGKYQFDPKVTDSQRSFLRREFGFQGRGSGGSGGGRGVRGRMSNETNDSSDGDLDSSDDDIERIMLSQSELRARKKARREAKRKNMFQDMDGRLCVGSVQGGEMAGLRSKMLVSMLHQLRGEGDDADTLGSQEERVGPSAASPDDWGRCGDDGAQEGWNDEMFAGNGDFDGHEQNSEERAAGGEGGSGEVGSADAKIRFSGPASSSARASGTPEIFQIDDDNDDSEDDLFGHAKVQSENERGKNTSIDNKNEKVNDDFRDRQGSQARQVRFAKNLINYGSSSESSST